MNRNDLIEQLAERRFGTGFGSFAYTELTEHGKEQYRALVREDWPLIVAFVADFIAEQCRKDIDAATCAQRWREEMEEVDDV